MTDCRRWPQQNKTDGVFVAQTLECIEQGGHPVLDRAGRGNAREGTGCWQSAKNTDTVHEEGPQTRAEGPRGSEHTITNLQS